MDTGYIIRQHENAHEVFETATEQVVFQSPVFDNARNFVRGIKEGKGFQGWTPSFILIPLRKG
jgi:hypothetical protein